MLVDERPVLRAEVLQSRQSRRDHQPVVAAGNALGVDPHERVRAAARMFSPSASATSRCPQQPENLVGDPQGAAAVFPRRRGDAAERVSVSVTRPDEFRRAGAVADRVADLGDQRRQVDVRDDGIGRRAAGGAPPSKSARSRLEQDLEQLERLGREGPGLPSRASARLSVSASVSQANVIGFEKTLYVPQTFHGGGGRSGQTSGRSGRQRLEPVTRGAATPLPLGADESSSIRTPKRPGR